MDKFRESRRNSKKKEQVQKLEGLSPEKFGKAAYQDVYFTPSRLADNVLYKEMGSMRKFEELSQKYREVEAIYKLLEDKYEKIVKEKAGIEDSLTRQIDMYKNLFQEEEKKAEGRLKDAQQAFKARIQNFAREKQEQVKFIQSEKEELEDTVAELQEIGNQLQKNLNQKTKSLKEQIQKNETLVKQNQNLTTNIDKLKEENANILEERQKAVEDLKQKVFETERTWRQKIDECVKLKDFQQKQIEKEFKEEINQINQDREKERTQKSQEIQNLRQTFQSETKRLNESIESKENAMKEMNEKQKEESRKNHNTSRGYQQQIASLAQEKARLFKQVDSLNSENTQINNLLKQVQINSAQEKSNYESYIAKLKESIGYNQISYLRERDENSLMKEDLSKEYLALKKENKILKLEIERYLSSQSKDYGSYNELVKRLKMSDQEIRTLEKKLEEKSWELEKCKEEFIKIGKQRDLFALKLEESYMNNGSLRRIKNERETEARTWRDSYYLTKTSRK